MKTNTVILDLHNLNLEYVNIECDSLGFIYLSGVQKDMKGFISTIDLLKIVKYCELIDACCYLNTEGLVIHSY